jgi:very-short-patch-repair endonuclease
MLKYSAHLKDPARQLRRNLTDSEALLWSRLRNKQLLGLQFYRQKPIGEYIVDFYAPRAKLVVEVDGSQHMEEEHALKDRDRDAYLASLGLKVLRFNSREVLNEGDAVVGEIYRIAAERLRAEIPPSPPFLKGGGGGISKGRITRLRETSEDTGQSHSW